MLRGLHEAGFDDLVAAHLSVLQYPGPENRRPSDLAAETRMSKQAMNYLLGQMELLGYIERRDDPVDQRSKRVHLTQRGRRAAATIRRTVAEVEAGWEAELGAREWGSLRTGLVRLSELTAAQRARAGAVR